MRFYIPLFLILPLACPAQTLSTKIYSGSGNDVANRITTDSAGNVYVACTTTSFDLPLLNPAQAANTGTQLVFSPDAGITWQPLGHLPNPYLPFLIYQTLPVAIDPTHPAIFYVAFNGIIFKSTDSGLHFSAAASLQSTILDITSIVVDPSAPTTLYVAGNNGLFKSTDGGATFIAAQSGLPAQSSVGALALDPFHPQSILASVGGVGYVSKDSASSWSPLALPANASVVKFTFDAVKPGVVYAPVVQGNGQASLEKSTDGGVTWSQLNTPFVGGIFAADPVRSGYLYDLSGSAIGSAVFYRSTDGGATWQSSLFPASYASAVLIDPADPNIVIAGSYRSADSGQTWRPTSVSRDIQGAFVPKSGALFATASITSDIFLAKFAPDGKTLLFATYFGGMGNETASGVDVDSSGNVWVSGNTNSFDLPVSSHAMQKELKGVMNTFLAEFNAQGKLVASTYFGSSGTDTVVNMKLDSKGDPWIFGQTNSLDFPFKNGSPQTIPLSTFNVFLAEMDSSGSQLLYSVPIDEMVQPSGMSIDTDDNIVLIGSTVSSDFPATPGVVHGTAPPNSGTLQSALIKLDSSGNTIFSTYLGGSAGADTQTGNHLESLGIAVTTDPGGIYIAGQTSATDLPITPGAYQPELKGGCKYPAFAVNTGLIGTIYSYIVDDAFVMKLSPDGKQLLYSTYLGGSCYDRPTDIAVNKSGVVFVAGETDSFDFPVAYPLEAAPSLQTYKSFVSMLGADGKTLPFSTYLAAGSSPKLAVHGVAGAYIAGNAGVGAQSITYSGFPNPPLNPNTDVHLARLALPASAPKLNLAGVLNAFSLLPGPVAPGEIVQLAVPDFAPPQAIDSGITQRLPLGTNLGGVEVLFDGKPAQVMSIFNRRIVCIAPESLTVNQNTAIQVNYNGVLSNSLTVAVAPTALGLLSANGSGQGLANARNSDGTLNSASNPAKRGTTVTVYFTGPGVPPQAITTNYGPARIAPLRGFVPGIYAAYFTPPAGTNTPSPLNVALLGPGASLITGSSQILMVYVK